MTDIAAPLFRRSIPMLTERRPEHGGVRALLAGRDYTLDALSADVVKLGSIDADSLLAHVLYDYTRFAFASLESHLVAAMPYYTPNAMAWPFVKLYYSAFYAGHAILRSVGVGIIRIDDTLPHAITQVGRIYIGSNFTFARGTYWYEVGGIGQSQMLLTLSRLDDGAAVHVAFWENFRKYIDNLSASVVQAGEPEASQVVARINDFSQLLRSAGAQTAGRLSEFRNAINYRHEYGVWFPFISHPAGRREMGRVLSIGRNASIRLDLRAKDQPVPAFRHAAHFVAAVSFDLAEMIIARSASKQTEFARYWARLKKDAAAPANRRGMR